MLEAWEIMRMNLGSDLAVLAACETARGRVGAGEGIVGMSWAFFVAGVPTTVVSQWKVDSEATSEMMVEFHKNMKKNKSKAESLREASVKLMKNGYDHPYYWAGFIVVGNKER
jgi:CHAT domain-containing protein